MDGLFFDLDRTLFFHGAISRENREALLAVQRLGHKIFLNTGRSRGYVPNEVLQAIPFDGLCCGSVYWSYGNKVLHSRTMPQEQVALLVREAEKHEIPLCLEGSVSAYQHNRPGIPDDFLSFGGLEGFLASPAASQIAKISFIQPALPEGFPSGGLRMIPLGYYVEGVPEGYTKATPMEALSRYLSIPREHMVAFGDSENDREMLAYAGRCAVIGHAPASLDAYRPYRTKSEETGVAEAISHFYHI